MKSFFPPSWALWIAIAAGCCAIQGRASNLVVTSPSDSGAGSLREALGQAQNGDTISFEITGSITNSTSDLIISNNVSIVGPGPNALAIIGNTNKAPRFFQVLAGTTASMSGLTLRDAYPGSMNGGGIYNEGKLAITNCVFTRCRAGAGYVAAAPVANGFAGGPGCHGGALYNGASGILILVSCEFLTNSSGTGGYGAGGPSGRGGDGGNGGAIYSAGILWALNCSFMTNSAAAGGAGGSGYYGPAGGSPSGSDGGNGGHGGAVYAVGPSTFINCSFGFNSAGAGGSAGAALSGTSARPPGGYGGAGGNGGNGGAILSSGELSLTSCTLANNRAGNGSAGAGGGAGFYYPGGFGGPGGRGGSGAVHGVVPGSLTACTFTANTAGSGGNGGAGGAGGTGAPGGNGGYGGAGGNGGGVNGNSTNALLRVRNVVAAANAAGGRGSGGTGGSGIYSGTSGTNGLVGAGPDLFGTFSSLGHNFIRLSLGNTGFTNGTRGDMVDLNVPTFIGQIGRNGGPTYTCPITATSSQLLDAGDDTLLTTPLNLDTDGRGSPRLSGGHVDIGAYEFQWPVLPIEIHASSGNGAFLVTFTNVPGMYRASMMRMSTPGAYGYFAGLFSEIAPGVYQWKQNISGDPLNQFFQLRWPN